MPVFLKRSVLYGPAGACLLAWLAIFVVSTTATAQSPSAERKVDFGRDIQPIFAKRCFACHGPDKGEGGLRLNQRETALAELDSGEHAVVPGHAEQSEIVVDNVEAVGLRIHRHAAGIVEQVKCRADGVEGERGWPL